MNDSTKPINLLEYENLATGQLSQMARDYYASGAGDEITLQDNRAAFARYKLRPRMLVDVSQRDLSTTILGQAWQLPIAIAPMAFQCLAAKEGEMATASAAAKLGSMMILSTMATKSLEEVASVRQQTPQWFQLYVHRDRALTKALVERAHAAGYQALCLTVDAPRLGQREKDMRNQFVLPTGMELANLTTLKDLKISQKSGDYGLFAYVLEQFNPALTWSDLEWLRSLSPLPLVVKGILRGDDALRAVEHGAQGIIVSNHGGRQLDGAIASLDALSEGVWSKTVDRSGGPPSRRIPPNPPYKGGLPEPPLLEGGVWGGSSTTTFDHTLSEVVAAVGDRVEVLVDGGIRRGTDVLKALALGAKAVLLGRPILWGLAVAGEAGVQHVLELLRDELDLAMALSGCAKLQDIDSSLVVR